VYALLYLNFRGNKFTIYVIRFSNNFNKQNPIIQSQLNNEMFSAFQKLV